MNTHEDSMPFRFTPDGLDETTIDALIEEANAQFSAEPFDLPTDLPEPHPVPRRAVKRTPNRRVA